jgi:hypothetical protein
MSLCGPSAAGISSGAEGSTAAGPAATTASPAPEASPQPTASSAPPAGMPYQPSGARGLARLLACQGQLRLALSGLVIGIDMDAAPRIAAARGRDLAVLSKLLPAAETGLVEALSIDRGRGDGL